MKAYNEDLAYIHDVGFGDFAKRAAPGLLEIFQQHNITSGLVVDLGCGSGIWANELVSAGYEVHGVDISRAMIKLAKQNAPRGHFQQASFLKAKLPPCVAVTAIGECFNYLFDPANTTPALKRYFARVYQALRPGGLFIFDVITVGRTSLARPRLRHSRGKDWAILLEIDENKKRNLLTRHITTFRRMGSCYRRDKETHRCQLYKSSELARELRRVGFLVQHVGKYGTFDLYKNRTGFIARKPFG